MYLQWKYLLFTTGTWETGKWRRWEDGGGVQRDSVQGWQVQEMSVGELVASGWMAVEQLIGSHLEDPQVDSGVEDSGWVKRSPGLENQEASSITAQRDHKNKYFLNHSNTKRPIPIGTQCSSREVRSSAASYTPGSSLVRWLPAVAHLCHPGLRGLRESWNPTLFNSWK